MDKFQPPANLKDFDRSGSAADLRKSWHELMNAIVNFRIGQHVAFYNPLNSPTGDEPAVAAPEWTGLPRTVKRLVPGSIASAAQQVEQAVPMGNTDPMFGNYTPPFFKINGSVFPGPAYRPQDEYLEWVSRRDASGTITEVIFTCEGPEYWDHIASDHQLLLDMYRELVGDDTIPLDDLLFPRTVSWDNPNRGGPAQQFEQGEYNPYNKWNIQGAVHLTQPANTLGAEISLAKAATRLYGNPVPVVSDPDLVCCGGYGGINRMSDPTIGSAVNTQVQLGSRVALRNPIGLYIKGIDQNAFSLPDDTPFSDVAECWEVLRPAPSEVSDMIVRARFRVPEGITHDGNQLRVGELKVKGEQVVTGGQVADVVTIRVFALAIPGAPQQERVPCVARPCPDPNLPDFIFAIPFSQQCPSEGVSPLAVTLGRAAAEAAGEPSLAAYSSMRSLAAEAADFPMTRYAFDRAGRFP